MSLIRSAARGVGLLTAAAAFTACDNEVPTATGSDLFPGGEAPTTLVAEFTGSDLILLEEVLEGFGDPRLTPFLLVANQFEGAFDAHAIARFDTLPDSVSYSDAGTPRNDSIASYPAGRILLDVDTLAASSVSTTQFNLYELTQAWDSTSVTWENAVDLPGEQVPWTTPGGARGTLLSTQFWRPQEPDSVMADTVVFELDSAAVARLRADDHPGVLVTTERLGARLKISGLTLEADARPAGNADTLISLRASMNAAQTFVFDPPTPEDPSVLVAGGLRGDRSMLTLDMEQEVEACPAGGGACALVPLSEVTLNRAQLVFRTISIPDGHRPLATPRIVLRTVAEPELGRFAPLGAVVASDTIDSSLFAPDADEEEFTLDLTGVVLQYLAEKRAAERNGETVEPTRSFALLAEFQVPDLGLVWFRRSPHLRIIYTLPLNPSLP